MQSLAIRLVRSRTDWWAGVGSALARDFEETIARERASYTVT
jgi:hypothetical protein